MRRALFWLTTVVVGVILAGILAVFGLDTDAGRRFAAAQLAGYRSESGMSYRIGRIDGSLYGRMTLREVEVRDLKGVFAAAPAIDLTWRPLAALRKHIVLDAVVVPTARLLRRPVLGPTDPNEPLLPDLDVTLGRLRVDRLTVEPAVTGQRHLVRLTATADIASGRARVSADAATVRAPGLAGGDTLALRLDAVPAANRLVIDARLTAPAGGLVDSYARLGKPLTLTVAGRGDWAAWQGRLNAAAAEEALADLAIGARAGTFSVRGRISPNRLVAGPAAALAAGGIDLDATAKLANRRADLALTAASPALRASAAGLIDLGQSRFGRLKLSAQLLRPGAIAPKLAGRDVTLAATLDGPFGTPTVDYALGATTLAFAGTTVEQLGASGHATVDANRILLPVHARARRVTGLNPAFGGLLTGLRVDGDLAWSHGKLLSDNLRLGSDRIVATAVVVADPAAGRYTGALKGRVNDYAVAGLGRVDLVTDARLVSGARGGFGIVGSVRATTQRIDNASVREQLGGNAVVTARFGYDPGGAATVSDLRVTAPRFRVTGGSGSYRPDGRIAFAAQGASAQYGPLAVTGRGTVVRPVVELRAAHPNVGVPLNGVVADLSGTAKRYHVTARGGSPYGPFAVDVLVRATKGPLTLDIARASVANIDLRGTVAATPAGPFAGQLVLAGSGLSGTLRLANEGKAQRVDADLRAQAARLPGPTPVTIGSGMIRATAVLASGAPTVVGTAYFADVRSGTLLVRRAQARFDYRAGRGTVGLIADGSTSLPFNLAAQAALTPTQVVANARGRFGSVDLRLAAPAVATKAGGTWHLAPATLITPQGRAIVSGDYGRASRLHAVLDGIDLALAEAFAPGLGVGGKVSGSVDAVLGGAVPIVDANITVARFTRTAAYTVSEPVDVAARAHLSAGGGDASALVRRGTTVVGRLQARLAPLAPGPTLTQRLLAAPLSGGIRYNGPAEVLWTLTGVAGQQLSGPLIVAADVGGHLDRPSITGVVRAATLRYENATYGTVISQIALDGRFDQSRLQLASLTGKAGSGTVAARGTVGLDAASGFPIDLTLTLDRAQLARSDALGATATGSLLITNGRGGGLVSGTLTIPEARYQVVRQGAADVPELTGVRRKGAPAPAAAPATPAPTAANFRLDLRVRADNRIFVSGMGLEAEWRTEMRVTGTAAAPVIVGDLRIVRGTYSFAGRRFDLAEDGSITFDGGAFDDPQLALSASTTVEGVSATIVIGGRAQRPEISFTSTPALAQDEVLARLLFGSSVTSLSPTQAIQLAAALNSLRGSGGGLNPLGKLRSASGIDRLRVLGADKTAGRGTSLAAGQYITNNVYVEVITDARGFTQTQLDIALTRTLSLLSATGSFGGSNVNLRYQKTY